MMLKVVFTVSKRKGRSATNVVGFNLKSACTRFTRRVMPAGQRITNLALSPYEC
jgi:hypothetical protein